MHWLRGEYRRHRGAHQRTDHVHDIVPRAWYATHDARCSTAGVRTALRWLGATVAPATFLDCRSDERIGQRTGDASHENCDESASETREVRHSGDECRAGERRERAGNGDRTRGAGGERLQGNNGSRQAAGKRPHFGSPGVGGSSGERTERCRSPRQLPRSAGNDRSRRERSAVRQDLERIAFIALLDNSTDASIARGALEA